jgi:WD40 repeat protein
LSSFRSNIALLIGINDYGNGIPRLSSAVADARRLAGLLRDRHGYEVILMDTEVTLSALLRVLTNDITRKVGPEDRMLFYFAGHGVALDGDDGPAGYLIPQDAVRGKPSTFFPMHDLQAALDGLPCRHLLAVLDCCFAGCLRWSSTRHLSIQSAPLYRERFDRYLRGRAWQAIASASHRQEALDVLTGPLTEDREAGEGHSPFAAALIEGLEGKADIYPPAADGKPAGDGVVTVTELFLYLQGKVAASTEALARAQTPVFWPLKNHEDGEFIFLSPGKTPGLENAPALTTENNPYRGLEPYDTEHKYLFAGRATVTAALLEKVEAAPLTVVTGASGTGKSSLVRAGLIPEMEKRGWTVPRPFRPGKSPITALAAWITAAGLRKEGGPQAEAGSSLAGWCRVWAAANSTSKLAVVIDQFEELVTQCLDAAERAAFLAAIAILVTEAGSRFRVVVTVRTDFEGQFRDTLIGAIWRGAQFPIPQLGQDGYREIVINPAAHRALFFDPPELVEKLINEVVQMPGGLPLLSFTLSEMYSSYLKRSGDDRCLTWADYEAVGGVVVSLRNRVERLYKTELKANERELAVTVETDESAPLNKEGQEKEEQLSLKRVMLRMVSVESGALTRRRVPVSELVFQSEEENRRVAEVLEKLTTARLVVRDEDADGQKVVEPAHDALVNGWDRLVRWSQEEQEQLALRRLLTPVVTDWRSGQGGLWWDNPRLTVLVRKARSVGSWLNSDETQFVEESEKKRVRRQWRLVVITSVVFLVLCTLVVVALVERNRAQTNEGVAKGQTKVAQEQTKLAEKNEQTAKRNAAISESRRLAALSDLERSNRLDRALLLAVAAVQAAEKEQINEPEEARRSLLLALTARPGLVAYLPGDERAAMATACSRDGHLVAAGYADSLGGAGTGSVGLFHREGDSWCGPEKLDCPEGGVSALAFSPDGQFLAAGCGSPFSPQGGVRVWKRTSIGWECVEQLSVPQLGVSHVSFNESGTSLVVGHFATRDRISGNRSNCGIWKWHLTDGRWQGMVRVDVPEPEARSIAVSPDGKWLAAWELGKGCWLWKLADDALTDLTRLEVPTGMISSGVFDQNSKRLAVSYHSSVSLDQSAGVWVWTLLEGSWRDRTQLTFPAKFASPVVFHQDGGTLAVGYVRFPEETSGVVSVWKQDRGTWKEEARCEVTEGIVTALAGTPDLHILSVGSTDMTSIKFNFDNLRGGTFLWASHRKLLQFDNRHESVPFPSIDGQSPPNPRQLYHIASDWFSILSPDAMSLAYSDRGRFRVLRRVNGNWVTQSDFATLGERCVPEVFSEDGRYLAIRMDATWPAKSSWYIVKATAGTWRQSDRLEVPEGEVRNLVLSCNGSTCAAQVGGAVCIWDRVDGTWRLSARFEKVKMIRSLSFNPSVGALAGGYSGNRDLDGGVYIWTRTDGGWKLQDNFPDPFRGTVSSVAFSPDGRSLAGAYNGADLETGAVCIWQLADGRWQEHARLDAPSNVVSRVVFSPVGMKLAIEYRPRLQPRQTLERTKGVFLIEQRNGAWVVSPPLTMVEDPTVSLSFTPDGNQIEVVYLGAEIRLRRILVPTTLDRWIQTARRIANRNLSPTEWKTYHPDKPYQPTFDAKSRSTQE